MTAASLRSAAVTGLGAVTPLGPDVAALWDGLLTGRSGVHLLEGEAFADAPVRLGATCDIQGRLDRVEARVLDRVQQLVASLGGTFHTVVRIPPLSR